MFFGDCTCHIQGLSGSDMSLSDTSRDPTSVPSWVDADGAGESGCDTVSLISCLHTGQIGLISNHRLIANEEK